MAVDFSGVMEQTDIILLNQGVYQPVTFTEVTEDLDSYDSNTGEYDKKTTVIHTFNAVILGETASNEPDSQYGVTLDIIVLARNITFLPRSEQKYMIAGIQWSVARSVLAPQNTIYQIALGRK